MSKTLKWADGDMVIDRNKGRPLFIEGTEKAAQDVSYFLMTSDDVLRQTGCGLKDFDTRYRNNYQFGVATRLAVTIEVNKAIDRLISWQQLELVNITDAERILGIGNLIVSQSSPTNIVFNMALKTAEEDILPQAYRIRLGQQFPVNAQRGIPGLVTDDNRTI